MNNRFSLKFLTFTVGFLISVVSAFPVAADDTEIFINIQQPNSKVVMILDTSRSMRRSVDSQTNRLTTMQNAISAFVNQTDGIDIGFTRMNEKTGAIVYPIVNLDLPIQENIQRINRPVTAYENNAYDKAITSTTDYQTIINIHPNPSNGPAHHQNLKFSTSEHIALRFENIIIPKGQLIEEAYLQIHPNTVSCEQSGTNKCGEFSLKVHAELSANSLKFEETTNNITNRLTTATQGNVVNIALNTSSAINWHKAIGSGYNDNIQPPIKVSGLKSIIENVVAQDDWVAGNAISLIIDTSDISASNLGGISNAASGLGPTLFIKTTTAFSRTITGRKKLIEEVYNQHLTYLTPTIPAIFDTIKYLTGAQVGRLHSDDDDFNLERTGTNRHNIFSTYERLSNVSSYENGEFSYPEGCFGNWLNSDNCQGVSLSSTDNNQVNYKTPLTSTCDETVSMVLLTDGAAYHAGEPGWWTNTKTAINDFLPNTTINCSNVSGDSSATACSRDLIKAVSDGVKVGSLSTAKKIELHTIGFDLTDTWLRDIAEIGKGEYVEATDEETLLEAFVKIGDSVLSKTTTFSNTPVSIDNTNQLTHDSDIYYALFSPSDKTSWLGNLKRYKLGSSGSIVDVDGNSAIESVSGGFKESSKSYWSTEVDGNNVIKGGASQQLANTTRNIYIESGNTLKKLTNNSTDLTTNFGDENFGGASAAARLEIVNWMLDSNFIADPLHSTPIKVVYPETETQSEKAVIFFGDNQGYIHAIDATSGIELYAFMPQELLKNQNSIRAKNVGTSHIYGMDGKLVTWTDNGQTYVLGGMRRGGSSYYALNVTNINEPTLAWKIQATGDFSHLGQTWSTPKLINVNGNNTNSKRLIFGGGYDSSQDARNTRGSDSKGNAIYLVNAANGALVHKEIGLDYSIPSDVRVIDIDGDNSADQVYVGDMGGRVLRFNFNDNGTLDGHQVIANLADNTVSGNRRFYHAPDVSFIKGTSNTKLAVAIGSGFRASPKNTAISDRFYLLKQNVVPSTSVTTILHSDLTESVYSDDVLDIAQNESWYFSLDANNGEKVLASSVTVNSEIWFSSFKPNLNDSGCSLAGGSSQLYRINVKDGLPSYKNTVPGNDTDGGGTDGGGTDGTGTDTNNSTNAKCSAVSCDVFDRFITLENATIPPSPVIIHTPRTSAEDTGSMVCVGMHCQQIEARKMNSTFWREGK